MADWIGLICILGRLVTLGGIDLSYAVTFRVFSDISQFGVVCLILGLRLN